MNYKILRIIIVLTLVLNVGIYSTNTTYSAEDNSKYTLKEDSTNRNNIYVNSTGDDNNNGLSPKTPKKTIKNATDTVSSNGIIYIAPGTYAEHNIIIKNNVTITGQDQLNTLINGNNMDRIFYIESGVKITLKNIQLTEGNAKDNWTYTGPDGYGGAVCNNGILNIYDTSFSNNTGKNIGGAIYNHENGIINITNSSFTGNHADYNGGAICNYGSITVANSRFASNHVGNNYANGTNKGGAIYNQDDSSMDITKTIFTNNHADFYGGAVYSGGILKINRCGFTNNSGTYSGGAIYHTYNILTVTNTVFTDNSVEIRGGAIYNAYGLLNVTNSIFKSNQGRDGGAIYNAYNLSNISGSDFVKNSATRYGGAISSHSDLNIISNNFTDNKAQNCGGVFYLRRGTCQIHFNRIFENHGTTVDNIGFDTSMGGMVNATLNWWGSNTIKTDQFGAKVEYKPWIVLTINPNSTINKNSKYTVTTDLCHDNRILNDFKHPYNYYHDPLICHVPDGIQIKFTNRNGNLNPQCITLINGQAQTELTGSCTGISAITAIIDAQIIETTILNKIPTRIEIIPINESGSKIKFKAMLTNKNSATSISGEIINFIVNSKIIGNATTDTTGKVKIDYIPLKNGNYSITAIYKGDNKYSPSEDTLLFTVDNNQTSISHLSEPKTTQIIHQTNYQPTLKSNLENNNFSDKFIQPKSNTQNNSTNNSRSSDKSNKPLTQTPWTLILLIIPVLLIGYIIYNKKIN